MHEHAHELAHMSHGRMARKCASHLVLHLILHLISHLIYHLICVSGVDATLEAVSTLLNPLDLPTLQQALSDLGLPTHGEKSQLSERITNALQPG